jgi:hypothetical protein
LVGGANQAMIHIDVDDSTDLKDNQVHFVNYTCARDPLTNACLSRLVRISNMVEN